MATKQIQYAVLDSLETKTNVHVLLAVVISQRRAHHVFSRLSHLVRVEESVQASIEGSLLLSTRDFSAEYMTLAKSLRWLIWKYGTVMESTELAEWCALPGWTDVGEIASFWRNFLSGRQG